MPTATRLIPLSNSPPTTKNKHFAINVAKNTGSPFGWAMNNSWMRKKNCLYDDGEWSILLLENANSSYRLGRIRWRQPMSARMASMSPVSVNNYTVKAPRGLAWIAWATNNGKTTADTKETYSSYYPPKQGLLELYGYASQ